ncbi:MAG TPA: M14 metallopeptidase family protein [Vicinamibacterales bacterium]|nr:M14 metallopeptidase family protein [Vicinamibacterales bacterium]
MRVTLVGAVVLALVLSFDSGVLTQGAVPTPASVFGFEPGADNSLATYDQVVEYLRRVDAASDRVRLVDAGLTTQGRRFVFALVSSPENLARIDRLREIARRLASPEGLSDDEARALAREGRAFVHIDGGLHSTEVAAPQHVPLVLDTILSRAEEPDMARILDEVVLLLWPTINPDGHQMVADWQMKNPPAEGRPAPPLPALYQEYIGHDNNRDAYMLNMVESRTMEYAWRQWEPQIIYVHHQSAPFPTRIWLPPFAEPIATHAPYLISRTVNMIGMAMAMGLEERGQVGATHMGTGFDAWYPGYIDYLPVFKNIAAFWTETQGGSASPTETPFERIREDMRRPQSLYASPWMGGRWRLRDAVEYMTTASLSVLDFAARYRENLLFNRYQSGRDQISEGRNPPYAYVFLERQRDPVALVELLRRLAFSGVHVYRYREESTVNGMRVPGGTWVVPTDQPFAALAREVLEVQDYPEIRPSPDGPLDQPYDAAGWTLPLAMGVEMMTATWQINYLALDEVASRPHPSAPFVPYEGGLSGVDAAPFDSVPGLGFDAVAEAAAIKPPAGVLAGDGPALAVRPAENNAFRAVNEARRAGASVRFEPGAGGDEARYVISGLQPDTQTELVNRLALQAERVSGLDGEPRAIRLGFYDVPTSMDHGWTRWVLEQYGFDHVRVTGEDLERGDLGERIDVLLISDESRGVLVSTGGRGGRGGGRGGQPDPAVEAANAARIEALDVFVRGGGTLVCLNRSATFVADRLLLPVRNVVAGLSRQEFSANGSLMAIRPNTAHQVMAGMPDEAAVFFDSSPVFETLDTFRGTVIASYQESGSPRRSGFLLGESHLNGKAAALDVEHGDGHVILIGFRPQWRGQTFGAFRVLFNATLYVD